MLSAHTTAVRSRLAAHPLLAGKIEDVVRRDAAGDAIRTNYVILAVNLPTLLERRLAHVWAPDGDTDLSVYVRVVAVDVDGVNLLMDAVHTQLQGHLLTVTGRNLTALDRDFLDPVAYDRATDLFHRDAWYEATSSHT